MKFWNSSPTFEAKKRVMIEGISHFTPEFPEVFLNFYPTLEEKMRTGKIVTLDMTILAAILCLLFFSIISLFLAFEHAEWGALSVFSGSVGSVFFLEWLHKF